MAYEQSQAFHERACRSLAGGVSSHFRSLGSPCPLFFTKGQGARLWDVDGNQYLDYVLGQGPDILGHAPEELVEGVGAAIRAGQVFAGQMPLELEVAETVCRLVPCADLIRFSSSGSEVDQAALRAARAHTGRNKYIRFEGHYHGWFDNVAWSINPPLDAAGPDDAPVPVAWCGGMAPSTGDDVIVLPWNNLAAVERALAAHGDEVAAILTEPIMCNTNCIEPGEGYLQGLRALADRYGVPLIFDEVITGFRVGLGGAQERYGVTPDLAVFGKACAAGYPIAILAGRHDIMQTVASGAALHAGTLNANVPCIAAADTTLKVLQRDGGAVYQRLFSLGAHLRDGLVALGRKHGRTVLGQGPGPMFWFGFTDGAPITDYRSHVRHVDGALMGQFTRALQDRGVRIIGRGLWYVSAAHTAQDIEQTLAIADEAMGAL